MPKKIERKFVLWAEGGVTSFAEVIEQSAKSNQIKVINPCVITCNRSESEYVDETDGLKKKKYTMSTEFFAYVYDAIFDEKSESSPVWTVSPNVTVLEAGSKFRPELIELYDGYIRSTSPKRPN